MLLPLTQRNRDAGTSPTIAQEIHAIFNIHRALDTTTVDFVPRRCAASVIDPASRSPATFANPVIKDAVNSYREPPLTCYSVRSSDAHDDQPLATGIISSP